jgi:hypothetical protein
MQEESSTKIIIMKQVGLIKSIISDIGLLMDSNSKTTPYDSNDSSMQHCYQIYTRDKGLILHPVNDFSLYMYVDADKSIPPYVTTFFPILVTFSPAVVVQSIGLANYRAR